MLETSAGKPHKDMEGAMQAPLKLKRGFHRRSCEYNLLRQLYSFLLISKLNITGLVAPKACRLMKYADFGK
jgi:hypothetical protein